MLDAFLVPALISLAVTILVKELNQVNKNPTLITNIFLHGSNKTKRVYRSRKKGIFASLRNLCRKSFI